MTTGAFGRQSAMDVKARGELSTQTRGVASCHPRWNLGVSVNTEKSWRDSRSVSRSEGIGNLELKCQP